METIQQFVYDNRNWLMLWGCFGLVLPAQAMCGINDFRKQWILAVVLFILAGPFTWVLVGIPVLTFGPLVLVVIGCERLQKKVDNEGTSKE